MRVGLLPVAVVDLMSLLLAPVTRPQQIESGGAMDIGSRLEAGADLERGVFLAVVLGRGLD
jgi:hypothetical protein